MEQEIEGSLIISDVIDADEGKYQCVAKNFAATRTSAEAILLMQGKTTYFNQEKFMLYIAVY